MNRKILFSLSMMAILMGSFMQLAASAEESSETPLGLEIAGKVDDVLSDLQSDILNFIVEKQLIIAESEEEEITILEDKKEELKAAIEETSAARRALFEQLQAGEISEEDFEAEMKNLVTDMVNQAKLMGELGELLKELYDNLGEILKPLAQGLSEDIIESLDELVELGIGVVEDMDGFDFEIPDNIPDILDSFGSMDWPMNWSMNWSMDDLPDIEWPFDLSELFPNGMFSQGS
jgi:hypothetical protein